jgi:hypothetical protein
MILNDYLDAKSIQSCALCTKGRAIRAKEVLETVFNSCADYDQILSYFVRPDKNYFIYCESAAGRGHVVSTVVAFSTYSTI